MINFDKYEKCLYPKTRIQINQIQTVDHAIAYLGERHALVKYCILSDKELIAHTKDLIREAAINMGNYFIKTAKLLAPLAAGDPVYRLRATYIQHQDWEGGYTVVERPENAYKDYIYITKRNSWWVIGVPPDRVRHYTKGLSAWQKKN